LKEVPDTTVIAVGAGRRGFDLTELELIASDPVDENVILLPDIRAYDLVAERLRQVCCVGRCHP